MAQVPTHFVKSYPAHTTSTLVEIQDIDLGPKLVLIRGSGLVALLCSKSLAFSILNLHAELLNSFVS